MDEAAGWLGRVFSERVEGEEGGFRLGGGGKGEPEGAAGKVEPEAGQAECGGEGGEAGGGIRAEGEELGVELRAGGVRRREECDAPERGVVAAAGFEAGLKKSGGAGARQAGEGVAKEAAQGGAGKEGGVERGVAAEGECGAAGGEDGLGGGGVLAPCLGEREEVLRGARLDAEEGHGEGAGILNLKSDFSGRRGVRAKRGGLWNLGRALEARLEAFEEAPTEALWRAQRQQPACC